MIQAIIFDYGGTIDTNSVHWSEVLWEGYQHVGIPVNKENFRLSYMEAERALAKHPYIRPEHNFLDLLTIKCDIETKNLVERGVWKVSDELRKQKSDAVAQYCYEYVLKVLKVSRPVIEELAKKTSLTFMSINTTDFLIMSLFQRKKQLVVQLVFHVSLTSTRITHSGLHSSRL